MELIKRFYILNPDQFDFLNSPFSTSNPSDHRFYCNTQIPPIPCVYVWCLSLSLSTLYPPKYPPLFIPQLLSVAADVFLQCSPNSKIIIFIKNVFRRLRTPDPWKCRLQGVRFLGIRPDPQDPGHGLADCHATLPYKGETETDYRHYSRSVALNPDSISAPPSPCGHIIHSVTRRIRICKPVSQSTDRAAIIMCLYFYFLTSN